MSSQNLPRLADRCAQFDIEYRDEYSMNETVILLGQSQAWVRRMVTGYRGKDKRGPQLLRARKVTVPGTDIVSWRIDAEAIEEQLGAIAEAKERREDRFNNPQAYMKSARERSADQAVNQVARLIAEMGISDEEKARLAALVEKAREIAGHK
jgi:hypothetical protein